MTRKITRILALDPGTRELGVAVFVNGSLVYASVESFGKLSSSARQIREVLSHVARLIRDFRPDVLALERNYIGRNRSRALLKVLVAEIVSLGRQQSLMVVALATNTVREIVVGNGWATKLEVARAIAARYPGLKAHLPPDRKWKRQYRLNLFDAVAVGMAALVAEKQNRSP